MKTIIALAVAGLVQAPGPSSPRPQGVAVPVRPPQRMAATSTVPEPAAWLLMIAGFGLVGSLGRRRTIVPRVID